MRRQKQVLITVSLRVCLMVKMANLSCRVQSAEALVEQQDRVWWTCQTCKQQFTGEMSDGLANEWWSQVCDRVEDDEVGFLPRTIWLTPSRAKESTMRRRRWSARCLQ